MPEDEQERLRLYRQYLLQRLAPPKPAFDPDTLTEAMVAALQRFTNSRGELKVDTPGISPVA